MDVLDSAKPQRTKPRWRWQSLSRRRQPGTGRLRRRTKPHWRVQFSLRTALLLMLVLGPGLGMWLRYERNRRKPPVKFATNAIEISLDEYKSLRALHKP